MKFLPKKNIIAFLAMISSTCLIAQNQQFSVGLYGGVANYSGDLQQVHLETSTFHTTYGLRLGYAFNSNIDIKLQAFKGKISGSDQLYKELLISNRNLSFESDIHEISLQGEVALVHFGEDGAQIATPYLLAGVGVFHFNPRTLYNGEWYDLQPIGTEGQHSSFYPERSPYSLWQVAIPLGIGLKINWINNIQIGFEVGVRKTFTDYLDDVSRSYPNIDLIRQENDMAANLAYRVNEVRPTEPQVNDLSNVGRGNPQNDDMYIFSGVSLAYKF